MTRVIVGVEGESDEAKNFRLPSVGVWADLSASEESIEALLDAVAGSAFLLPVPRLHDEGGVSVPQSFASIHEAAPEQLAVEEVYVD